MQVIMDHFYGKTLKFTRQEQGITQQVLAFKAGLDRTYISMLERGLRQPSLETIICIAEALNTKASDMIEKIEDKIQKSS